MADSGQLEMLRAIVGAGHGEDTLVAALRRAGGDLAAAVNIVLDGPAPAAPPCPSAPASGPILLDLDDSDLDANDLDDSALTLTAAPAAPSAVPAAPAKPAPAFDRWAALRPEPMVRRQPAESRRTPQEKLPKRQRLSPAALETPPKHSAPLAQPAPIARPPPEWSFPLGAIEIANAYSTVRVGSDQCFQDGPGGDMVPLLRPGARVELRWASDKKRRVVGRPGTVEATMPHEGGSMRFSSCGMEVGKLPTAVARCLVPLLARSLISVEARVGPYPPMQLSLGTDVPLVVGVTLRGLALSTPGSAMSSASCASPSVKDSASVAASTSDAAPAVGSKRKAKSQTTSQAVEEEKNRESQRHAVAMLLEQLRLPRKRSAQGSGGAAGDAGDADAGGPAADAAGGPGAAEGEDEAGCDEAGEAQEDMSTAAAAQMGGRALLERSDLSTVAIPEEYFLARLRHYQAQAVYWMWSRENPSSELPGHWLGGGAAQEAPLCAEERGEAGDAAGLRACSPAKVSTKERPMHPMWDEYELSTPVAFPGGEKQSGCLYHHRTTGALSLDFPDAALAHCRGGILADDMGLGKTVMCLGLLSLDVPADVPSARIAAPKLCAMEAQSAAKKEVSGYFGGNGDAMGGNLVILPVSLIMQWHAEVERHFPPDLRPTVHEYHGAGRGLTAAKLRSYDIVLTTYGTLSKEGEDGPLFQIYWRRLILDEAHNIKNRCALVARSAFRLRAFCRWCITGTPLQNSADELYSLVKFLRVEPYCAWPEWRQAVTLPLERGRKGDGGSMTEGLDTARRIVQPMLLRRTKATRDPQGELLLELPPKHVHVLELELSEPEKDFYAALYKKAQTTFDTFVAQGDVLSKYTHILGLILKLRQALCHPFLVFARDGSKDEDMESLEQRCLNDMLGKDGMSESFVGNLLEDLRKGTLPDCPICCDPPEDAAMTPCGHIFCRECAAHAFREWKGECPVCRRPGALNRKALKVLPGASRFPARLLAKTSAAAGSSSGVESCTVTGGAEVAFSTKMRELLRLVRTDMEAGRRAVVFSQWTSFLDLVGSALEASGIPSKQFNGSLNRDQRQACVEWLSEEVAEGVKAGRVLLVSLKAGGVGLNLVAASRLYMLDLWWNPAVEEQAIHRVHRIGQKEEVHVYKFVVKETIDMDMLDLNQAKARLLEDAIEGRKNDGAASKLTLDDLKRIFNPCRSVGRDALRALRNSSEAASSSLQEPTPPAQTPSAPSIAATPAYAAAGMSSAASDAAPVQAAPRPAAPAPRPAAPAPTPAAPTVEPRKAAPAPAAAAVEPAGRRLLPSPTRAASSTSSPGEVPAPPPARAPTPQQRERWAEEAAAAVARTLKPREEAAAAKPPLAEEPLAAPEGGDAARSQDLHSMISDGVAARSQDLHSMIHDGISARSQDLHSMIHDGITAVQGADPEADGDGAAGGEGDVETSAVPPFQADGSLSATAGAGALPTFAVLGDSDDSDSDLLAACRAVEIEHASGSTAPGKQEPASFEAAGSAPVWKHGEPFGPAFGLMEDPTAVNPYSEPAFGLMEPSSQEERRFGATGGCDPLAVAAAAVNPYSEPDFGLMPSSQEEEAFGLMPSSQEERRFGGDAGGGAGESNPYGAPAASPYGAPAASPYGAPAASPYGRAAANPYDIPASTNPYGAPAANPPRATADAVNPLAGREAYPDDGLKEEVMCKCDPPQAASMLTVRKEGANHGRRFHRCSDCGFFEWATAVPEPSGETAAAGSSGGRRPEGFDFATQGTQGAASGRGGSSDTCYKCGNSGHWARDCPGSGAAAPAGAARGFALGFSLAAGERAADGESSGPGKGAGRGTACFRCGQEGHFASACTSSPSSRLPGLGSKGGGKGGGGKGGSCFKCGQSGHWARDCRG